MIGTRAEESRTRGLVWIDGGEINTSIYEGIPAVFALFILALRPEIKANIVIEFMAKYSLALYCLHPFLIGLVKRFVFALIQNEIVGLYLSIILVIVLSYSIGVLLRKYYFRKGVIM
jgi:membrane-bound acyltransferase YfiQ involved in biofilm formation